VQSPLEFEPVRDEAGKVVRYKVGAAMNVDGTEGETLVKFDEGLNITTGMGKPNELATRDRVDERGNIVRRQQITAEAATALEESGQLVSGEEALARPAEQFKGKKVLGVGGGPTSEWVADHALQGGAASIEIAGSMPRPKSGPLAKELDANEAAIRELIHSPTKPDDYNEQLAALTAKHDEIVATHVRNQEDEIARLEQQIADPTIDPGAREKAEQTRSKLQAEVDPFAGSRVDRNVKTLGHDKIDHFQADVMEVTPIQDGPDKGRVCVTYTDGRSSVVDQVIPSIGQNPNAPGGVNNLLQNMPEDMKLMPVIAEGRVVGLASDPAGITISGAAMTGTLGTNMPSTLLRRIPQDMRGAVIDSIVAHANRPGVSADSKGIVPGIENVGMNPELMQEALQLDREAKASGDAELEQGFSQDQLRKAWLAKYKQQRTDDGLPEQQFDDNVVATGQGVQ
jgi:hypothetical protein